jgi:uncharacterized protein YbjT (DUF2867 family)
METERAQHTKTTLVVGGTGKTGRRVVERLEARGLPVRVGSRSGEPPFDWEDETTWAPALWGVESGYVTYYPDLAVPGAADTVRSFAELAVRESGVEWTILRCSFFAQNFSESFFLESMLGGELALPAGGVAEPFVDADDIADVAVEALTENGHAGELYELTGPWLLTFAEAVEEIGRASGREVRYVPVSVEQFASALSRDGVPSEVGELLTYLFTEVLDGRNALLTDGIWCALSREPKDFADYARDAAATGVWHGSPLGASRRLG